jgi:hypothetical protein
MTHIKNHTHAHGSHNSGHHHFCHKLKNGHDFTYLLCDKSTHIHSGKHISTNKKGVETLLYAIDGVKVHDAKPHAKSHAHQGHAHSHHAARNAQDHHEHASHPKRKRRKISQQGEAGQTINKARRRSTEASKPTTPETQTPNTDTANSVNQASAAAQAKPISNLAQYIAANPNKIVPYLVDEKGQDAPNSQAGLGIVKDEASGKFVVLDDALQSIPLETNDPTKLTENDKKAIAAALQAGKLHIGKFVDAQAQPPAASDPANQAPASKPAVNTDAAPTGTQNTAPLGGPMGGETKIQPTGGATPAESTTPEVPATPPTVQPATGGTPADAPPAK